MYSLSQVIAQNLLNLQRRRNSKESSVKDFEWDAISTDKENSKNIIQKSVSQISKSIKRVSKEQDKCREESKIVQSEFSKSQVLKPEIKPVNKVTQRPLDNFPLVDEVVNFSETLPHQENEDLLSQFEAIESDMGESNYSNFISQSKLASFEETMKSWSSIPSKVVRLDNYSTAEQEYNDMK